MPECAKTLLLQSRISKFSGGEPRTPSSRGGEGKGREGRRGREKGREGGRGRIGKGGEGREGTGKGRREGGEEWGRWWGGEGRGARHGLRPPRDKLWIRPWLRVGHGLVHPWVGLGGVGSEFFFIFLVGCVGLGGDLTA